MSLAPGTRKGYQQVVCQFGGFRKNLGYRPNWPILVHQLLHFGVFMKDRGFCVCTIQGRFSALGIASKTFGFVENTGDFRIRKMLEGRSCEAGHRSDPRQPLSLAVIRGLWATWGSVCASTYEFVLFHAEMLIAFFAALRLSELVASSMKDVSGRALVLQDVHVLRELVHIRVWSSKMDWTGKGQSLELGLVQIQIYAHL